MGTHANLLKKSLTPESFESFLERLGDKLEMREEIATKFRDINPPKMEHLFPDMFGSVPWYTNFLREKGGLDQDTWFKFKYEEFVEWAYRIHRAIERCEKATKEKLPSDELIETKWLSHMSHPPAYLCRADLGFPSVQTLYGKYATTMWAHIDWWRAEVDWLQGFHNEDGVPVAYWVIGASEKIAQHFDEEDEEKLLTSTEFTTAPDNITELLNRRHLRTGVKMRDIPKKSPYSLREWLRPIRDVVGDLREDMFPDWTHAALYISPAPGDFALASQQVFWATSQWWHILYLGIMSVKLTGLPFQSYTVEPMPPILNTLLTLPVETWIRRLGSMFLSGPGGMICDAINPMATSKDKTPLLHDLRQSSFEGGLHKNYAKPNDEGIPPPKAYFSALPAPLYKETFLKDFVANPENLSNEYLDYLESELEIEIDRENVSDTRIPPYSKVPRLEWLFDPEIEWLQPKDFPPFDWSEGQIWPIDITREKMEIMVDEGYDGSGKDILHYSALADKKMGQEGKTITLGTMPYDLPTE